MTHSYMMQAETERLERLWQDQHRFFPSIQEYGYKFPYSIDYYRYLDSETLKQHIGSLEYIIEKLQESTVQITRALDWCYMMTPNGFEEFLTIIPWILTAGKTIFLLPEDQRKINTGYELDTRTREEEIDLLHRQYHFLRQQIRLLSESVEVIKFTSSQLRPKPFIEFNKSTYVDDEVVVGFFDDRRFVDPYVVAVADSTIGTYHMAVRPLTKEELENSLIDLPTIEERAWMERASYDWVMPMEVYRYYYSYPGLASEHASILEKSGVRVPTGLKILVEHFKK